MTEAMFEAGFGSYAQFYKVFRAQYGRGRVICCVVELKYERRLHRGPLRHWACALHCILLESCLYDG